MIANENNKTITKQDKRLKENIKFSIIIPVFNSGKYLNTCLSEIYKQTYDNIEIICVNDGSTDQTDDVIEFYKRIDSSKQFIGITQENRGVSYARNTGLKAATGDYIVFVDADDWAEKSMLRKLASELNKQSPDILVFGFNINNEGGEIPDWIQENSHSDSCYYSRALVEEDSHERISKTIYENSCEEESAQENPRNYIDTTNEVSEKKFNSVLEDVRGVPLNALFSEKAAKPFIWRQTFKRSLIVENDISFPAGLPLGEDNSFLFQCYAKAKDVRFIEDKLYYYRINNHDSAMTKYHLLPNVMFQYHLQFCRDICINYKAAKVFPNHAIEFAGWMISFLYYDWINFNKHTRHEYAKEIIAILEEMDMSADLVWEWDYDQAKEIELAATTEPASLVEVIRNDFSLAIREQKDEISRLINTKSFRLGRKLTLKKQVDLEKIQLILEQ